MNNTPLTEVLDDEVSLLVVHDLGVLVRDALAPADGVAAHQDLVGARGLPHNRYGVITRLSLSFCIISDTMIVTVIVIISDTGLL